MSWGLDSFVHLPCPVKCCWNVLCHFVRKEIAWTPELLSVFKDDVQWKRWLAGRLVGGSLVGRSVGRSVGWLVSRSIGRLVGWLLGQSAGWSVVRLVGWLVGRSVARSLGRLVGWLVSRSIANLVGWLVARSVGRLFVRSVGRLISLVLTFASPTISVSGHSTYWLAFISPQITLMSSLRTSYGSINTVQYVLVWYPLNMSFLCSLSHKTADSRTLEIVKVKWPDNPRANSHVWIVENVRQCLGQFFWNDIKR